MSTSKWYFPAVTIWPPWGEACWCSCWLWAFCAQATRRLIAIGAKTNVSPMTVHIQLCQRMASPLLCFRGNKHSDVSVNQRRRHLLIHHAHLLCAWRARARGDLKELVTAHPKDQGGYQQVEKRSAKQAAKDDHGDGEQ